MIEHRQAPEPRIAPLSFWLRATARLAIRPGLWATGARQVVVLARRSWWRRAPFVPVPDGEYLRFRFETQYGDAAPDARDVVTYLEWCRQMRSLRSSRWSSRSMPRRGGRR